MRSKEATRKLWKAARLAAALLSASGVLLFAAPGSRQASAQSGKAFDTADEAAQTLIQAAATYDVQALLEILGPSAKDLVASADPVNDRNKALAFAAAAREKTTVTIDPKQTSRAELDVGNDATPFPIPIVQKNGKWYFDIDAGRKEILYRRIGENEFDAILICRGYVEAQHEYALTRHGDSLMTQYAQRIISSPGKQDGLAWQNPDGSWAGPVGETIASAIAEGYAPDNPPYHGYYFKVLKGQGPAAPLGSLDFVVEGAMIGGFALVAAPAQYRVTGVKTFIVSHDGVVFQKDLGSNTLTTFETMTVFNPDKTWSPVNEAP